MSFIKIAKTGKSALSTDERDLAFSSKLDYLKEQLYGLSDTDNNGDLTITHNLGYVPAFAIFVADFSDTSMWYSYDMIGNVYATSTQLVIQGAMGSIKSKVYYSIFSSQL